MESTQPTKTKSEPASQADTSGDLIKSNLVAGSENSALTSSSSTTNASTPNVSTKTWTSAELAELRLRVGLVAGALADFQTAGGIVVVKNVEVDGNTVVKIYLVAEGLNVKSKRTTDGIDLVAEPSGIVAEGK